MKRRISFRRMSYVWAAILACSVLPGSAWANFHLMEIEQVIGGVSGDTTAQAVQLKMRFAGQNIVGGQGQVVVRDAAGLNPVTIATFPSNVTSGACREILLATNAFAAKTSPAAVRDFAMTAIPASYLAAGSLTFESVGGGATWWRVSWGGAGYTGSYAVISVGAGGNDDNGTTTNAVAGALPSGGVQALRFTPACATTSTDNASQYAATAGAAVFTNNALAAFTVTAPPAVPALPGAAKVLLPALLGLGVLGFALYRRRRIA